MTMALLPNTSIKLGIHEPKKNAVVAQPGTDPGANEIRIYMPVGVAVNLTQNLVGDFHKLHRMAQTVLKDLDGTIPPDIVAMELGGSDNDILINGVLGDSEIRLEIGAYTGAGDRSHFLDRTFKRLIERLLEEAK